MKKGVRIGIIISFVLFIAVFGFYVYNLMDNSANGGECLVDSDCVMVQTTCCPCNMGGEEKCVSKNEVGYYENKIKEACDERVICPAVYNCNEDKTCGCINGECE